MYAIEAIQNLINNSFTKEIDQIKRREPSGLYEPICYALQNGGKRIRPTLVLLGCNLFCDQIENALSAALSLEIFHNFTLLHDDIMDKAELRRNRPTVHRKYSENTAILSGDAMNILAYKYLCRSKNTPLLQLLNLFNQTALEVCEGQQMDMDFETSDEVGVDEYLEMIRLKTAVLLACSLKTGALIANAPETDTQLIYDFGINIGIAFQLRDDLLDTFGDRNTFGKNIGGDILCNKKTYLLLQALSLAQGPTKSKLTEWIFKKEFDPQEKINKITAIFNQLNIKESAEKRIQFFHQKGLASIEKIKVPNSRKEPLYQLISEMIERDH